MTPRLAIAGFAAAALAVAGPTWAQSRPMPPRVGLVSLVYQHIDNTAHRLSDGFLLPEGQSISNGVAFGVDYGVSPKLSLSVGVPYIGAKYTGLTPTPANLPVDSGHQWHSSMQDFTLGVRYGVLSRGPFALTPAFALVLPSHAYDYQGEAVVGRRLREAQLGLGVVRTLQEISPRLEIGASYAYAFVQKAEVDIPNDRSNASLSLSYLATRKLQLHGAAIWQRTHGGLRFGGGPENSLAFPGEVNTAARFAEHDRLLRDNNVRLEGGLSYSLGSVDVFASYLAYASGTDTHAGRAVTVGASWYFGDLSGSAAKR